jgi:hypothetical protein
MDGECTEDPAVWDGAKVAQVLRDAGISAAGAAAIEVGTPLSLEVVRATVHSNLSWCRVGRAQELGLDGATLMRLTPDDFATDEVVRCAPPRQTCLRHTRRPATVKHKELRWGGCGEQCIEEADQRCVLGIAAKLIAGEPLLCDAADAADAVKQFVIPSVLVDADGHSYFGERSIDLKGSSIA